MQFVSQRRNGGQTDEEWESARDGQTHHSLAQRNSTIQKFIGNSVLEIDNDKLLKDGVNETSDGEQEAVLDQQRLHQGSTFLLSELLSSQAQATY